MATVHAKMNATDNIWKNAATTVPAILTVKMDVRVHQRTIWEIPIAPIISQFPIRNVWIWAAKTITATATFPNSAVTNAPTWRTLVSCNALATQHAKPFAAPMTLTASTSAHATQSAPMDVPVQTGAEIQTNLVTLKSAI